MLTCWLPEACIFVFTSFWIVAESSIAAQGPHVFLPILSYCPREQDGCIQSHQKITPFLIVQALRSRRWHCVRANKRKKWPNSCQSNPHAEGIPQCEWEERNGYISIDTGKKKTNGVLDRSLAWAMPLRLFRRQDWWRFLFPLQKDGFESWREGGGEA